MYITFKFSHLRDNLTFNKETPHYFEQYIHPKLQSLGKKSARYIADPAACIVVCLRLGQSRR